MRTITLAVALCLVFTLIGCQGQENLPPPGQYKVEVRKVVSAQDLVICSMDLTFAGTHKVGVYESNGLDEARYEPAPGSDTAPCEIVLVADFVKLAGGQCVKWLVRIHGPGVTAGGPATYTLKPGENLGALLDIRLESGNYPFDAELELARFMGKPVRLKVQ